MTDESRKILELVAAGQLAPEEAEARLAAEDTRTTEIPKTEEEDAKLTSRESDAGLRVVRIEAAARRLEVIGDPDVHEVQVDGEHEMKREGDALVIDSNVDDGFTMTSGVLVGGLFGRRRRIRFSTGGDGAGRFRELPLSTLHVRMNSRLALEIEGSAATVTVRGVDGPIEVESNAGAVTLDGFKKPIQVNANAAKVNATGSLTEGHSNISCNAGTVRLHLLKGSSVRVTGQATLGKLSLPGAVREEKPSDWLGLNSGPLETTVGDGAGRLDISVNAGKASVTAD